MPALRNYPTNFVLVFVSVLLSSVAALAQDKTELNESTTPLISDTNSSNTAYYYPDFRKGKVTFISGTASTGIINYNQLNEYVEFITSKKDTLVFDEMYLIDMITVNSDTFYYDIKSARVLKLLGKVNGRKLLVKENPVNLAVDAASEIMPSKIYYLSDKAEYVPASPVNLLKLYPAHAATLRNYLEERQLELKSEEEIKQVLEYAVSLK